MEQVENQVASSPVTGNTDDHGSVEERARELGRKVDSASARVHSSWDEAASQMKDKLGSTGARMKAKFSDAGTQAKKKLSTAKVATKDKAQEYRVNVEHQVQAHPMRTIGVAFGAGALLGLLLRRRR